MNNTNYKIFLDAPIYMNKIIINTPVYVSTEQIKLPKTKIKGTIEIEFVSKEEIRIKLFDNNNKMTKETMLRVEDTFEVNHKLTIDHIYNIISTELH